MSKSFPSEAAWASWPIPVFISFIGGGSGNQGMTVSHIYITAGILAHGSQLRIDGGNYTVLNGLVQIQNSGFQMLAQSAIHIVGGRYTLGKWSSTSTRLFVYMQGGVALSDGSRIIAENNIVTSVAH